VKNTGVPLPTGKKDVSVNIPAPIWHSYDNGVYFDRIAHGQPCFVKQFMAL